MNEIIFFVTLLVLGFVVAVIGLTRGGPEIHSGNRAEIAQGLFEHFMEE